MAVAIATTNFKINMTTDLFMINEAKEHFQTNHAKHAWGDNTNILSAKVQIKYKQTKSQIYFHECGKYMKNYRRNQRNPKDHNCHPPRRRNKR